MTPSTLPTVLVTGFEPFAGAPVTVTDAGSMSPSGSLSLPRTSTVTEESSSTESESSTASGGSGRSLTVMKTVALAHDGLGSQTS